MPTRHRMSPPAIDCGGVFTEAGYAEVILPAVWEAGTFVGKIGPEKEEMMWRFVDRGDRDVCLVPEATGMLQDLWNGGWKKTLPKPTRIFYVTRCYRYERPQAGRYREFTQVGIEILGAGAERRQEVIDLLRSCLDLFPIPWEMKDDVTRGIGYYTAAGFEAECGLLGAQKQIAGGGIYPEGLGWAIGLDRVLLACREAEPAGS